MRARTGLWEPWGGNAPGPPGPLHRSKPGPAAAFPTAAVRFVIFHLSFFICHISFVILVYALTS